MNIKALITALVLGSSSLALASPSWSGGVQVASASRYGHGPVVRDHRGWGEPVPSPIVRDHRGDLGSFDGDADGDDGNVRIGATASAYTGPVGIAAGNGWVTLAQRTRIGRSVEEIAVGASAGRFRQLQVNAVRGETKLRSIVIEFGDHSYQRVNVQGCLDANNPTLAIRLAGRSPRNILRVIVEGSSGSGALYSIFAV